MISGTLFRERLENRVLIAFSSEAGAVLLTMTHFLQNRWGVQHIASDALLRTVRYLLRGPSARLRTCATGIAGIQELHHQPLRHAAQRAQRARVRRGRPAGSMVRLLVRISPSQKCRKLEIMQRAWMGVMKSHDTQRKLAQLRQHKRNLGSTARCEGTVLCSRLR